MRNRKNKLSLWARVKAFFVGIYWKFRGEMLHAQLQDHSSPLRTDAQKAVDRVVYETNVPPDCVSGMIVRGAPAICVKHDPFGNGATTTVTIGNTYDEAAEKTIEWLDMQTELTFSGATELPRKHRRAFNAIRQRRKQRH